MGRDRAGPVNAPSVFGARVTFMRQGAGHVYGTGRTRLWDGGGVVGAGGLDDGPGPVNGMELKG